MRPHDVLQRATPSSEARQVTRVDLQQLVQQAADLRRLQHGGTAEDAHDIARGDQRTGLRPPGPTPVSTYRRTGVFGGTGSAQVGTSRTGCQRTPP